MKSKQLRQVVITDHNTDRFGQVGHVEVTQLHNTEVAVSFGDGATGTYARDSVIELRLGQPYEVRAVETEAPITPELMDRYRHKVEFVFAALTGVAKSIKATMAEQLRKEIIYGRSYEYPLPVHTPYERYPEHEEIRMAHGILGFLDEIEEITKPVILFLSGDRSPETMANLLEELGDLRWFLNLCILAAGFTTVEVEQANLKKLNGGRYKAGSFTEAEAINRDVTAEQQLLLDLLDEKDEDA